MDHGLMFDSHQRERKRSGGFIILVLLVLMAGCGPAPSDEVSRSGATAGSRDAAVTRTETGISRAAGAAGPAQIALPRDTSSIPAEPLVVPAWMAKELDSPDVSVRLQALDRWEQQGHTGSVDPLLLALNDPDERVQELALALIEQDWARAQAEEK